MLEILSQSTDSCLAVHFSGKVTGDEYRQFLEALNQRLGNAEKVSLVLKLSGFVYGDFETAAKDIKFGFGEYKRIHRVALVGNQKWIEWFIRLIGPLTRTEEKRFLEGQNEAACVWASS